MLYWTMAAIWGVGTVLAIVVRFPEENRAFREAAEVVPQGEGLPPTVD